MVAHYGIKPGDRILDVGCGKGFLLYDFTLVVPGVEVTGIDVSEYAIGNAKEEVRDRLRIGNATSLPWPDKSFDLVISIQTLHNLHCYDLDKALREMERVGRKHKYLCVESYRNETEKVNLLYWQVTCEAFNTPEEWQWWFRQTVYTGDHSFIFFSEDAMTAITRPTAGRGRSWSSSGAARDRAGEAAGAAQAGQVLVRIACSGICGSQLGEIDGAKGEDRFLPHLLGHEGAGTVLEVGPGVRHVKARDTVVLHWRKGRGIESATPSYDWNGRKANAGWVTTFNEYAVVSENRLTPIPADTDPEIAALFGCAVTTGFGVVQNNARVRIGESVVVFGAGGVGLNIVQACALVTARPIIAVDLYDGRLELAKMGATHLVNARGRHARDPRHRRAGGRGRVREQPARDHPLWATSSTGAARPRYAGRRAAQGQRISIHSLPLHFGKGASELAWRRGRACGHPALPSASTVLARSG